MVDGIEIINVPMGSKIYKKYNYLSLETKVKAKYLVLGALKLISIDFNQISIKDTFPNKIICTMIKINMCPVYLITIL